MGSDGNMKIIEWKWIALLILVIQNSSLTLMMRYSRIVAPANVSYITSTAVVAAEAIKLFLSCILCIHQDCNMNISEFLRILRREFTEGWKDFLKLFIPSGLYVLQNNLQYIAASNLPADVFQVLSQMKVITTAIFSGNFTKQSIIFQYKYKKLSFIQWISVIGLAAGLGVVQVSQSVKKSSATAPDANFIGFVCVICSSLTSGFAGVYFEKPSDFLRINGFEDIINPDYNSLLSISHNEKFLSLPNTVSISFKNLSATKILPLIQNEVACSAGSACHSSHTDVMSTVLTAMKVPPEYGHGTLRLSVGRHSTTSEVQRGVHAICRVVRRLIQEEKKRMSG
eukprot:gene3817-7601_t